MTKRQSLNKTILQTPLLISAKFDRWPDIEKGKLYIFTFMEDNDFEKSLLIYSHESFQPFFRYSFCSCIKLMESMYSLLKIKPILVFPQFNYDSLPIYILNFFMFEFCAFKILIGI